jgi:NTP pyrophosphatase (non-canonical NTP hydrolase)
MRPFENAFNKMLEREESMKYEELSKLVIEWGESKGILAESTPLRQLDKTQEELDETRQALQKLNDFDYQADFMEGIGIPTPSEEDIRAEVKDGIGDMLVTIVLLAKMVDMDTVDSLNSAYGVIKKRTGKMVDGQFIKDQ